MTGRVARYDTIGSGYTLTRRADRRIGAQIGRAIGAAATVVNVGAGTGSYEPIDRIVVAVDPSEVMLRQRHPMAPPGVLATAERLPFANRSFDVAMATTTVHHWTDRGAGLREMRRVADRQVILLCEPSRRNWMWLTDDYFPAMRELDTEKAAATAESLSHHLDVRTVEVVPIPRDCEDGFGGAYWNRPDAYLDPSVQAGISMFRMLDPSIVASGTARLADELASGEWDQKYGHLRARAQIDLGYRLVIAGG